MAGPPLMTVYSVTNPMKNDVRNERRSCPIYVFHIFGFACAISFSFSLFVSLSKPRYVICQRPIGVNGPYHTVPTAALMQAPRIPMSRMVDIATWGKSVGSVARTMTEVRYRNREESSLAFSSFLVSSQFYDAGERECQSLLFQYCTYPVPECFF